MPQQLKLQVNTSKALRSVKDAVNAAIKKHESSISEIAKVTQKALQDAPVRQTKPFKMQTNRPYKVFWPMPYHSAILRDSGYTVLQYLHYIQKPRQVRNKIPAAPKAPRVPKNSRNDKSITKRYKIRLRAWKKKYSEWKKHVRELQKPVRIKIVKGPYKIDTAKPLANMLYRESSRPGQIPFSWPGKGFVNLYLKKQWYKNKTDDGFNLHIGPNTTPKDGWGNEDFLNVLEYGGSSQTNLFSPGYFAVRLAGKSLVKSVKKVKDRTAYYTFRQVPKKYSERKTIHVQPRPFVSKTLKYVKSKVIPNLLTKGN